MQDNPDLVNRIRGEVDHEVEMTKQQLLEVSLSLFFLFSYFLRFSAPFLGEIPENFSVELRREA